MTDERLILLTGATGYVGGRLLHALEERGEPLVEIQVVGTTGDGLAVQLDGLRHHVVIAQHVGQTVRQKPFPVQ